MRGNELLDRMDLIDPAFVEAADAPVPFKNRRRIQWAILAACLCVMLCAVTAVATSGFGTRLIERFTSRTEPGSDYTESGYKLQVDVEKIPFSAMKGQIRDVPSFIREQFRVYKPYMSWFPGHWQKTFASRDEACDYIGFGKLKYPRWDLKETGTDLNVYGTDNGNVLSVMVETRYTAGDIRLQFFSKMYTEKYQGGITLSAITTEYAEFSESVRTTANHKRLHIIRQTALASGYLGLDGYLVEDGVLYNLHIAYLEEDAQQANELLHRWADLF